MNKRIWNEWVEKNREKICDNSDYFIIKKMDIKKHQLWSSIYYFIWVSVSVLFLIIFYYLSSKNYFKSTCEPNSICAPITNISCLPVDCGDINLPGVQCTCPSCPEFPSIIHINLENSS